MLVLEYFRHQKQLFYVHSDPIFANLVAAPTMIFNAY